MGVLDTKILAGLPVTVNAEYHNSLVDKLADRGIDQTVRMSSSASHVIISHADDAAVPASVVVSDDTDWRGMTSENLYIAVTVNGLGAVSASKIDPNGSVNWTWAGSSWSSGSIPGAATVTFTPYQLTAATTIASVAAPGNLPGSATSGDRIMTRSTRDVYVYTTSWAVDPGPNWSAMPSRSLDIVIEPSFDPAFTSELVLVQQPEADNIRLVGGTSTVTVQDFSAFPSNVTTVSRAVVAEYIDAAGDVIAAMVDEGDPDNLTYGVTITGGTAATWHSLTTTQRAFTVEATVTGRLRLTTTYSYSTGGGDTDIDYVRVLHVGPPERMWRLADDLPEPPSIAITALDGRCAFKLGTALGIYRITETGLAQFDSTLPTAGSITRSLAARLAANGVVDPEANRAVAAAETLRSILSTGVSGRVKSYTIEVSTTDAAATLSTIRAGHMLYFPSGALRVMSVTTSLGMADDGTTQIITATAYGKFDGALTTDGDRTYSTEVGWASSNADLVSVAMTFAYGTLENNDFPTYSFTSDRLLAPVGSLPEFEVALPAQKPNALTDRWYVKADVTALWPGGEATTTAATTWVGAEAIPSSVAAFSVTADAGDTFRVALADNAEPFYGTLYWDTAANARATTPDAATILAIQHPLSPKVQMALPASAYDGRVLVLDGHHRSRGGTSQVDVMRFISGSTYKPTGLGIVVGTAAPEDPAPDTNGVIHTDGTGHWVSFNGSWIQIAPAASNHYTKTETYAKTETYTQTEIDAAFYTQTASDSRFAAKSTAFGVQNVSAGTSVTNDATVQFEYNGVVYKLLAETVAAVLADYTADSVSIDSDDYAVLSNNSYVHEVALFDAASGGDELTESEYARMAIRWEPGGGNPVGVRVNDAAFTFPQAASDWGTVYLSIRSAVDGAELCRFDNGVAVVSGQKLRVQAGILTVNEA